MKFTRTTYPDIPGHPGDPCWQLAGRYFYVDADWNTRFPFGTSFSLTVGPRHGKSPFRTAAGFLLDLNPPLGEPNRLYLNARRVRVIIGLPAWHRDVSWTGEPGEHLFRTERCLPYLEGYDRYRYHRDEAGNWVRNARPEPMHWGWLTAERARKG